MANENQQPKPDAEVNRRKKEEQARRARRRNRQLIGVALSVLIVMGVFSIFERGFGLASRLLDDTSEKHEFKSRVDMLVRFEMLPFSDPSLADANALRQVIIWSIYFDKRDELERVPATADSPGGNFLVPVLEVNRYAAGLFGPNFLFPEHGPFEEPIQGMYYGFDEEKQAYIMPITGLETDFMATIAEIKRESGGVKRVVVGYVRTRGDFDEYITPDEENPAFYYDYLFRRDGNAYYLFAIEPSQRVASAPSSSSGASSMPAMQDDTATSSEVEEETLGSSVAQSSQAASTEEQGSAPEDASSEETSEAA